MIGRGDKFFRTLLSTKLAATAIAALVVSTLSTATKADTKDPSHTRGIEAGWLSIDAEASFDLSTRQSGGFERNLRTQDAEVIFEIALAEGIRAIIKTELERVLIADGSAFPREKFSFENFIEEAYIQIETDKFGLPRATLTFGKHHMAFGQRLSELPMFKDNLIHHLTEQDGVIGLTVEVHPSFLRIADSVAISVFEAGADDFKFSKKVGGSVKLTKKLTERIQLTASALYKQAVEKSMGKADGNEMRGSLGLVWTTVDGHWKVYSEGVVFSRNPIYPDSHVAGSIGTSRRLGPGAVVVEYSFVQAFAQEIGAAYNLPIGRHLIISPEIRYQFARHDGSAADTIIGIRARLRLHDGKPKKKLESGRKDQKNGSGS